MPPDSNDDSDDGTPNRLELPEGVEVQHLDPDLALLSFPLPEAQLPESLTEAEQEIALQLYAGATNEQIAESRGVTTRTIANQLVILYRKLGVTSRVELVLRLRGQKPQR
jgi:DNA-binding NarL/FixJ family response regulator